MCCGGGLLVDLKCWIVPGGCQLLVGRQFRRGSDAPNKRHGVVTVGPGIAVLRHIFYLVRITVLGGNKRTEGSFH